MRDRATVAALREQFLLDPDVIFLNHGSFGACPRPVFERYQAWQRELKRQPVEFIGRRLPARLAGARAAVGAFVGARGDDLVFVPNATTALNVVARSLALEPGDEVLGNNHEYGALDRTWRFLCAKRGARYVRLDLPLPVSTPEALVEAIWAGVTARTRVLFLSHITSPTALRFPVEPLVARAREAGILTVIDGAHAPGQIPLDLDALGADFYAGNLHKWPCAPKGTAFLHARREAQPLLEPLIVSWGWESEFPGASRFIDEQEYTGTADPASYLAAPAAFDFLAENGWDEVRAGCHELVRYARERVSALTGLPPIAPDGAGWVAQMATLPLPDGDAAALKARLYDAHRVEIPIIPWEGRRYARISIQGYNAREEVDAFVEALAVELEREGEGEG